MIIARSSSEISFDSETRNLFFLSLLGIVESFQILCIIIFIVHPQPVHSFLENSMVNEWKDTFKPERELFFFAVFTVITFCLYAGLFFGFYRTLSSQTFGQVLSRLVCAETVLTAALGITLFQMINIHDSPLMRGVFYSVLFFSFLIKIFWKKTKI